MSLQTSLANYFNSKKRRAVDEIKKVSNTNKVLILDNSGTDVSVLNDATSLDGDGSVPVKNIFYNDSPKIIKTKSIVTSAPKLPRKTPKTASHKKLQQKSHFKQGDIRKSLLGAFNATLDQPSEESLKNINQKKTEVASQESSHEQVNVPFEIKGSISPRKTVKADPSHGLNEVLINTQEKLVTPEVPGKSTKAGADTLNSLIKKTPVKESISQIRAKLIKSNRLDEIKNALKRLNEGDEKLKTIQAKSASLRVPVVNSAPELKKFDSVSFEILSPTKSRQPEDPVSSKTPDSPSLLKRSLLMSPGKSGSDNTVYISPRKLFTDSSPSKAVAFERHAALVAKGKPSLTLPFKYRTLAETFRAVDTVVSMLQNRNETILFSKLKASVQQMSKKNLSENHLAQIHSVCPDLFTFKQEKLKHMPGRDKYELAIAPVFESNNRINEEGNSVPESNSLMTPSTLLERKRKLYAALLEKTKDYHQKFLLTLDPPIHLDRSKLSRWHPEFDVDGVPDIQLATLPQPPNVETFSSAKDVLSKARDMFICNPRMEKALERVSNEPPHSNNMLASASIPALANALKGIPSSLLEKVRAKQAAKAAESLTRNPQTVKRKVEYSRLHELARIVRNVFIGEKKNILKKTLLLAKLSNSFREVLTPSDLEYHLKLLIDCTAGWLTTVVCHQETFYKIAKDTDLSKVITDIHNAVNKL